MAGAPEPRSSFPQTLAEAAVRSLRHEVGDLLQTVYATSALLQQRLPAESDLERRILTEMKARAESCRWLLDVAHDLLCPMTLMRQPVDLAELIQSVVAAVGGRYPNLRIEPVLQYVPPVLVDAQRIEQTARAILTDACAAAVGRVEVALKNTPDGKETQWTVSRDGSSPACEQLDKYFLLDSVAYQGPAGLGMILARRIVRLHGGRITASNRSDGGLCVAVYLPANGQNRG